MLCREAFWFCFGGFCGTVDDEVDVLEVVSVQVSFPVVLVLDSGDEGEVFLEPSTLLSFGHPAEIYDEVLTGVDSRVECLAKEIMETYFIVVGELRADNVRKDLVCFVEVSDEDVAQGGEIPVQLPDDHHRRRQLPCCPSLFVDHMYHPKHLRRRHQHQFLFLVQERPHPRL